MTVNRHSGLGHKTQVRLEPRGAKLGVVGYHTNLTHLYINSKVINNK